jgi:PKD repeat protein
MHTKVSVPKLRMTTWLVILSFMILMLFAVSPVQAADPIRTITSGDNVFIGEYGLDINSALNGTTTIVRFNNDDINNSVAQMVTVTNPASFDIDRSTFESGGATSMQGIHWYPWTGSAIGGPVAFVVYQPGLTLKILDETGPIYPNVGETVATRYFGTKLNFRISTNLDSIVTQRNVPDNVGFIDIYVKDPTNVKYSSLFTQNSATSPKSIINLWVNTTTYHWSNLLLPNTYWLTSARNPSGNQFRYPVGLYTTWAEATLNGMNLNNPYGGAISLSDQVNLVQESLSVTTVPSVTRTNSFTANITGRPNTEYTIWILNNPCHVMTGGDCDQPPMIPIGQRDVRFDIAYPYEDDYPIGSQKVYPTQCLINANVRDTIPYIIEDDKRVYSPEDGIRYYANVETDENGFASIRFDTSTATAPITYTVHVQGTKLDGDPIFADAQISVNKGTVSITMNSTAILGDKIPIRGTNSDSFTTYLYLTGPCQPQCGASLETPGIPLSNEGSYTKVSINNTDHSWIYNESVNGWDTSILKIQPGVYTIYASAKPINACDFGPCDVYATSIITLLEPTLTAKITPETLIRDCCTKQTVIVTGTTTGNPAHLIGYWVLGEQKVGDVHWIHNYVPDCCGNFEINLSAPISQGGANINLKSLPVGKYYVVLQHPMYNHLFDVILEDDFTVTSPFYGRIIPGNVIDEQYLGPNVGQNTHIGDPNKYYVISSSPIRWSKIFPIEGADSKRELDALNALIDALNSPGIDDKYIVLNFTVKDANAPTAEFVGAPVSGSSPLTVLFTDQSQGTPTIWSWDFGDGTSISPLQNPQHTYINEGDYSVKLTASKVVNGITVSDSITKEHYIHVGPIPLQAAFTGTPRSGQSPLAVQFTDQSTGVPTSWFWDFGDGQYSSVQNPSHTYATPGSFAVTLTASKLGVSNSLTIPNYIVVSGVPTTTPTPTPTPVPYDRITLNPGWNFVSTPKTLASGYNTGSIFANVDMGGRSAWIWNGALSPPQWVPVVSTTPIQPLWGIWIYSVSSNTVNLVFDTNSMSTPPSRSLPAGWNGIGFTGTTQQTARNTYLSVQPNWTTSMGFNSVTQQYGPTIFNGDPTELTMLFPTKGYWLYMRTPGSLAAIGA